MDYLKLAGKSAIVTGGGQGIGGAIAQALAQFGVEVMICDINDDTSRTIVDKIRNDGGTAAFCHCDVSNVEDVRRTVEKSIENFGKIDILINNAGIGDNCCDTDKLSDEKWNKMMDVNLKGPFNFCREVIPHFKKQYYGKIVNISSGGGLVGMLFLTHYATAKAGMIGLTKSIAQELAPYGINVNCIAVPTTFTPATVAYDYDANWEDEIKSIPMGRIAQPKDIADMVLYLVSDASAYVTNQVLAPNGGKR
jgi:NAD(P)-dependent dehydrogenase (short-subunit alcohol dehydrogenase family)